MDKRQLTLRFSFTVAATKTLRDLMSGKHLPQKRLYKVVGNFLRAYSRKDSEAIWQTWDGETAVCFSVSRITEAEADLISDRLAEMAAANDVTLMGAAFPEAIRRALGDGVELVKAEE